MLFVTLPPSLPPPPSFHPFPLKQHAVSIPLLPAIVHRIRCFYIREQEEARKEKESAVPSNPPPIIFLFVCVGVFPLAASLCCAVHMPNTADKRTHTKCCNFGGLSATYSSVRPGPEKDIRAAAGRSNNSRRKRSSPRPGRSQRTRPHLDRKQGVSLLRKASIPAAPHQGSQGTNT